LLLAELAVQLLQTVPNRFGLLCGEQSNFTEHLAVCDAAFDVVIDQRGIIVDTIDELGDLGVKLLRERFP
jgi:hypothetical protein